MSFVNKYYIAIPAYNEENTIEKCLLSIKSAKKICKKYNLIGTYICLNGCTDNTSDVVKRLQKENPSLKIKILTSQRRGMNYALNKIMDTLTKNEAIIIKVDADTEVDSRAFQIILNELEKHPELKIVGGQPIAKKYTGSNVYKKILSRVLDIRSHYPESQVAVKDVTEFHPFSQTDPQPLLSPNFEKRSRIYFHGRFYALRNKKIWDVPGHRIGDDTYLTLSVYKRFKKNSIRIRYDACCYYHPSTSLKTHWKVYKRIFLDTYTLFKLPQFNKMNEIIGKEAVKLDWAYIQTPPPQVKLYFIFYWLIKQIESILFNLMPKKYKPKVWSYKSKPKLQ